MKKPVSLVVGAVLASMIAADMAEAQTLEEALATAYTNNPTLLARRARTRSVDEGVPQAKGGWRPTVTLEGSIGRSRTSGNNVIPTHQAEWNTPRVGTLTVTQPLYRGGRTTAGINQAENNVQAERAALSAVEQDVLLNSATAYMNVVRDQAVLELNINNEQVLRRQLEAAQDRFRVGEITRTDVSQAEARLSRSIADRVQSEGNLQASRANFQNVVGILPEKLTAPTAAVSGLPASLEEAVAQAGQNNPTLLSSEYAARSAQDGIDLVRGELLPEVALQGESSRSYGSREQTGTGLGNIDTIVHQATLNVTVPLYQSGAEYARLRAQKHVAGQRRIEVDQARRTAVETVTQAWEGLVAAKERGKSYQSQIQASTLALEGVEREAQVGSRTVLDVLNAEQELLDARVNAVRAQRDEAVASFQLKSAVGRMTAQGMSLPVEVYDPALHYEEVKDKWIGTGLEASLPPEAN